MKKSLFYLLLILLPICSFSQINELNFNHQRINFSSVPRSTLSPMSIKLWDNYNNGGPTSYGTVLEIYGLVNHQTSQLYFGGWDNSKIRYREAFYAQNTWSEWITLLDSKNDVESGGNLKISGTGNHYILNGNFGIGVACPQTKLDVAGTIRADEVKVDLTRGCDFVFKNNYKLMNLKELERFVKTNKHLPEIAPEKEMVENGVNMKEMQMKLLQKVEELTLYIIEQNKKMEQQNQEIIELKKQNEKINALTEKIEIIQLSLKLN